MKQDQAHVPERDSDKVNNSRREFLRNSVYAAYATPLITALLVDAKSAAASPVSDIEDFCDKFPEHKRCQ